jgi:teichuronic acid biosynthesis glycosyltransferase TuaG
MFIETSIITPMYNCNDYIVETITSVLNQSYQNWELILVDDCSTDGTFENVKLRYEDHLQVKIIQNSVNSGAGYTRNNGLKNATGRYIAFLDSDDIWSNDKLQNQIAFMKVHNAAISHTSFSFVDENSNKRNGLVKVSKTVDLKTLMKKTEIGTSTAIIDRNLIGTFSFELMRTRQDIRLWMELLSRGHLSYGLDEILVYYRIRKNQISGNKIKMLWKTFNVYISFDKLAFRLRLFYFLSYVKNSILKRMKSI